MRIQIVKFYYGDIPEEHAGGNELKSAQVSPTAGGGGEVGRFGRYSSAANKGSTINM